MTKLIHEADKALLNLTRGFQEGMGTPSDLEDALQMVHDTKQTLLGLTERVRKQRAWSNSSYAKGAK